MKMTAIELLLQYSTESVPCPPHALECVSHIIIMGPGGWVEILKVALEQKVLYRVMGP